MRALECFFEPRSCHFGRKMKMSERSTKVYYGRFQSFAIILRVIQNPKSTLDVTDNVKAILVAAGHVGCLSKISLPDLKEMNC